VNSNSTDPGSSGVIVEPAVDDRRARVLAAKQRKAAAEEERALDGEVQRLELAERFERELGGPEGQQFAIHDATDVGEGFFVVKLAPSITFKTYWDSKMTDVDRCDFVTSCLVYPTREVYLAARGRRMGIDAVLSDMLGALNGLKRKSDSGK
jgi:hypothetical protein